MLYAQYHNSYPSSSYSTPSGSYAAGTPLPDCLNTEEQLNARVQLRNKLNSGRLYNMPGAFPFNYVYDGHGSAHMSYYSYEFKEELRSPTTRDRARRQNATFSFSNPSHHPLGRKAEPLTWRIYLPHETSSSHSSGKAVVAQVKVEPEVLTTTYGKNLMAGPQLMLRALSISLELGLVITISMTNSLSKHKSSRPSSRPSYHSQWRDGTVLYLGSRDDNSEQEVLYIIDPR
ncbi:hypothetical protein BDQ12DRAFT_735910 [Crucibulum laeve]|uniref:Uncharacterized protein n=1 Tax=Crucibulum laeve TaxID=68775 RepID=A0A5C3LXM4_9AGAR|nr:hypothetical protein BDQ12DRAFT_735910 [Crucibulum laeve]